MAEALHVYVAGSSREIPRVREAMRELVRRGCTISGDWVSQVEQHGSAGAQLTHDQRAECAAHDLNAIDRADAILVLWPRTPSVGAYVELGYAIRCRDHADARLSTIVIADTDCDRSIWHAYVASHRGCEVVGLDDEAVATLVSLARDGGL